MVQTRTSLRKVILDPVTTSWTNLVKDYKATLHTKVQAFELSNSLTQNPRHRFSFNPGAAIWTNFIEDHQEMLQTKFQASEHSCSERADFLIFVYVFLWFKPSPPPPRLAPLLGLGTFIWTHLAKNHYAMLHTEFQAPELSDSEKERFLNTFICISMGQIQEPLAWGYFGPWDLCLNKPSKGSLGFAT